MKIELAQPKDYQRVADIYNEYIASGQATMDEELKTAAHIAGWVEKFNDRERLYVMRENEAVIGWGIIKKYSDRQGYRFTAETAIYLQGTELGKGHGTAMKKYLIEQSKLLNYRHLVAKIWAINEASIQYNLKLGYTVVGTQKEIGFRNNQWLDVTILQLILN